MMKIVIVEDEIMVARRVKMFCDNILGERIDSIVHFLNIEDADDYINSNDIDLLLLDLNLNARDGFELLKRKLAASFNTIVISANTDRAIEAFEYGVLDFIGKPFRQARLQQAIERANGTNVPASNVRKYLPINKHGRIEIIAIDQIAFIQASGHYCELNLTTGTTVLHDKNLERLLMILPSHFHRVHKSYALPIGNIKALIKHGGSQYSLETRSGETIPLGRTYYPEIKSLLAV